MPIIPLTLALKYMGLALGVGASLGAGLKTGVTVATKLLTRA